MTPSNFIFRISLDFDTSIFSLRNVRFLETYFNNAIKETFDEIKEEQIVEGVQHDVLVEGENRLSLYISHTEGEDLWDGDILEQVVCQYFITLFIDTFMILLPKLDTESLHKLNMTPFQYINGITITSSVNNEILLASGKNEGYEEDALYISDWVLNSVPMYSNIVVSKKDINEEITDEVMFTTKTVKEYLEEDKNNRILFTPTVRDGTHVKRSWSVLQKDLLKDKNVFEGSKRYGCYNLDTLNPLNVDSRNALVDLQAFGSYNIWVPLTNFEDTLLETDLSNPEDSPAFSLIPSFTKYASLVNVDVFDSGASVVSRLHCQDTGRKVIKVHKIVPTFMEDTITRKSCVTTDRTFRMNSLTCEPGLKKDGGDNQCCEISNQELIEQLVLLSSYRNVDFPARLNYLNDILSWYSEIRPIPSPWSTLVKISVGDNLPRVNEGILDVIGTLKPTIMNAIVAINIRGDESVIINQLRETIRNLNVEKIHHITFSFMSVSRRQEEISTGNGITNVIFEEVIGNGNYPMGNLRTIMSWNELSTGQIFTACKTIIEKERFEMKLVTTVGFKRNTRLTSIVELEAEDEEADAFISSIKEKIEETFRRAGYKQKLVNEESEEEEPYRREHVEINIISFWKNNKRDQRAIEIIFKCGSKLPIPRKFIR